MKTAGIYLATGHPSCLPLALTSVALSPFPLSIYSDYISLHIQTTHAHTPI